MTINEINNLLDKVKMYRPFYEGSLGVNTYAKLKSDWYKGLGEYSYDDVNEKLEEFFRNENNNNKIPNPYQLRDGLITENIKNSRAKYKIQCMFCGRWLDGNNMEKHENRCRSIKYIESLYKKFDKKIADKKILYDMSDNSFNQEYIKFLKKILPLLSENENIFVKKVIKSFEENKIE